MMGGGVGGIVASCAFVARESPSYTVSILYDFRGMILLTRQTGVWVTFALSMSSVAMIVILDIYLWRCNKAVKAGKMVIGGRNGWLYTL
jgi:hypothetical protein